MQLFTLDEKIDYINKYTSPKKILSLSLGEMSVVFLTAGIVLGKDTEMFERFVSKFWDNFEKVY